MHSWKLCLLNWFLALEIRLQKGEKMRLMTTRKPEFYRDETNEPHHPYSQNLA